MSENFRQPPPEGDDPDEELRPSDDNIWGLEAEYEGEPVYVVGSSYKKKGQDYVKLSDNREVPLGQVRFVSDAPASEEESDVSDAEVIESGSSDSTDTEALQDSQAEQTPDILEPSSELPSGQEEVEEGSKNEGGDNGEDTEASEAELESSWLDPRRIEELQARFQELLEEEKKNFPAPQSDNESVTEHHASILKTRVLEKIIAGEIKSKSQSVEGIGKGEDRTRGLADKYPDLKFAIPEEPTEEVKARMLAMLDKPEEELHKLAAAKDKQIDEHNFENAKGRYTFKEGQEVQHISKGEKGAWIVRKEVHLPSGNTRVELVNKNNPKEQHFTPKDRLRQEQDWKSPEDVDKEFQSLKQYFGKEVNIKLPDGTMTKGRFKGVSRYGGVYLDHYKDRVGTEDFLSWQEEAEEKGIEDIPDPKKGDKVVYEKAAGIVVDVEDIEEDAEGDKIYSLKFTYPDGRTENLKMPLKEFREALLKHRDKWEFAPEATEEDGDRDNDGKEAGDDTKTDNGDTTDNKKGSEAGKAEEVGEAMGRVPVTLGDLKRPESRVRRVWKQIRKRSRQATFGTMEKIVDFYFAGELSKEEAKNINENPPDTAREIEDRRNRLISDIASGNIKKKQIEDIEGRRLNEEEWEDIKNGRLTAKLKEYIETTPRTLSEANLREDEVRAVKEKQLRQRRVRTALGIGALVVGEAITHM